MVRNGVFTQNHISLGISVIFNKMKYFMSLIFCAPLTVENNSSIPSGEPILLKFCHKTIQAKSKSKRLQLLGILK